MIPTNREEFGRYCLTRLGFPVIEINVAEEQIDDRIDDALSKYWDYHFDGVEEEYLVVQITDSDVANGYIQLADDIFSVIKILPVGSGNAFGLGGQDFFSVKYQFYLNDLYGANNIVGGNISYIESFKSYLETINMTLNAGVSFNFNRKTNRLRFNENIASIKAKADIIVLKIYKKLDVETFDDVWADEFLKDYTTALIKRQWGENLKKYGNLTLPGGITISGQEIYSEAATEVERLEKKLSADLQLPLDFYMG
jgi:hypothetical protein